MIRAVRAYKHHSHLSLAAIKMKFLHQNLNLKNENHKNDKKLLKTYETILNKCFHKNFEAEKCTRDLQEGHQPNQFNDHHQTRSDELIDDFDLIITNNYDSFINFIRHNVNYTNDK